jgi:hypothetical protein
MAVYVFGEPGMLLVKIGRTGSPRNRVMELERLDRASAARMLYVHREASGRVEHAVHCMLRSRFWLEGEWFVCGATAAKSVVRHLHKTKERERRHQIKRDTRRRLNRLRRERLAL